MEEEEKGRILEQAHRPSIKLKLPRIEDVGPRCSLCGRQFSSMKSLFGHMRCHPERPWRGINPPPSSPIDSVPTSHLSQSLSGWSVTGKRGRTPASRSVSVSGGPLPEDHVVHDLLMLAQAGDHDSGTNDNWVGNSWSKKLKVVETEQEEAKGVNLNFNFSFESKRRSKTMRKRRKKKRLRDLEIGENKYMCSMCNKTFKTHQALGGHKSSHNKHATNKIPSMAHHHHHNDSVSEFVDMEQEEEVKHQCKVCDRSFSSGQALGGHKRCHWSGAHQQQPSSQVTSAGTGQKILGFDLNYPPPMDQDEEGIDSGFFNPKHILG